jgi:tape measure domain-containing protein
MAFGGVIKLQGESEYRKALSDITNSLKVVGSELKKVSSLYDRNDTSVEKLSSTNETLTKKLKLQNDALDKARDMLKEAQSGYEKSADSVKEWQQKLEQAREELDKAKSSTEASADEIADLEAKVKDCETELGKAETTTAKYDTTVKRWTVEVNNAETAVNKTTREIDKNESAIKDLESATDNAADSMDDLSDSMDDTSDKSKKLDGGFTVLKGAMADLVSQGINFVMDGLHDLVGEAVDAADTMYKFEQTMGFAGYDNAAIKKASADVKDYADKTVYDLDTIANTTAQLAANGIKDYTGLTQALGNLNAVAGGNADTFNSVSIALTQTAGAGKLTTENWNQLANAIPGASGKLQEALKEAGAYTGDFREAMAKGQITADEFNAAIMKLGNEPVAVEAAASVATFEGAIGNMQATVISGLQEIISEIGMENITEFLSNTTDLIGDVIKGATDAVRWVKSNLPAVLTLVTGLMTAFTAQVVANKVAVIAATAAEKGMTIAQYAAATAQGVLNAVMALNPIGLIIAGITALVAGFMLLWNNCEGFRKFWINLWENIKKAWNSFKENWAAGMDAIKEIFSAVGDFFSEIWDKIKTTISEKIEAVKTVIETVFTAIKDKITTVWTAISSVITTIITAIKDKITAVFNAVKSFVSTVWEAIKTTITDKIEAARSIITDVVSTISSTISSIFNGVKSFVSNVWNGIKDSISNAITAAKNIVSNVVDGIKSKVTGVFDALKSTVTNVWNGIKNAIKTPIEAARDLVKNAIDKMKSFFNFKWELPKIKLPHFSISGKFSLNPPSIPKFSVDWYAKAMNNPMLLDRPTIFGMQGNKLLGAGEAGAEVVAGADKLMSMIRSAVDTTNRPTTDNNFTAMLNAFKAALREMKVEMDSDEMGRFVERTVADAIYT